MDEIKKVFANKHLDDFETEMMKLVFEQHDIIDHLKDNYIYIHIEEDGEIEVLRFPDDMISKTCTDLFVTPRQAIEYLYSEETIEQEIAEMLYWADIDDYKKYVPVVKYEYDGQEENKVYADYYFFAKDDYEAIDFMARNAFFDYLYLENIDGD
jgi:hypothetical protein